MPRPKGIPATKKQKDAGSANLAKWQQDEGHQKQALTHGAYSATIRQRYSDLRTTEGRRLQVVIDGVVNDLGGPTELNAAQQVVIGSLRSKLIVVFQISGFLDRQESIINKDGYILPVLGQNFLQYQESIRRDLETLYGMNRSNLRRKVPKLSEIINGSKEK